ncbi:hypothetical protein C8J56DRAFT_989388 [Mycena floridula]|nr:hypothetical protein C8J56DRAFT_989388 [Mycena floridula]
MFLPRASPFLGCSKCQQTTSSGPPSNYDEMNSAYESHYTNFFPSNHPLPDDEADIFQEIASLDIRLVELKSRIAAVASLMDQLLQDQKGLQRSIALRKGLVCPIRKLPNEILENIFMDAYESSCLWSPFDMEQIPWVIGQVCRRWRQIACESCASLWSTFEIIIYSTERGYPYAGKESSGREKTLEYLPAIVRECLHRSGDHSLTFTLNFNYASRPGVEKIMEELISHCDRWRFVTWEAVDWHAFTYKYNDPKPPPLEGRIKGNLPLLESFHWDSYIAHESVLDIDTFSVAPRLRRVTMPTSSSLSRISFPWAQLQYLELGPSDEYDCKLDSIVLQRCSNLVECNVTECTFFPPTEPFIFNHLRILHCQTSTLVAFVNSPVLEELHLDGNLKSAKLPITQRLSATLTTVSFSFAALEENVAIAVDILLALSNVTTLSLGYFSYEQTEASILPVIDALRIIPAPENQAAMPRLRHISVENMKLDVIPQWLEVVQSRLPDLQSLRIAATYQTSDFPTEHLEQLRNQGVQINWTN